MLKIRLARIGKKKKPTYRLTVSETTKDTFGKFLEILGHYNPITKVCEVKKDRILYWLDKGTKLSPTVHNLLVDQNIISEEKVKVYRPKKKKKGEKKEKKSAESKKTEEEAKLKNKSEEKTEAAFKEEKPKKEPKKEPEKEPIREKPKEESEKYRAKPTEDKTKEKGNK